MGRSRTAPAVLLAGVLAASLTLVGCSTGNGRATPDHPDREYPGNSGAGPGAGAGRETDAEREPRSTFAIDIDTASYGFARRQILDGRRPDPSTVRPEEFVNAFRQDYPQPAGDGFAVVLDGARLPRSHRADGDLRLVRVGLQTRAEDPAGRPDAALTFVIDVSGSMAEPGRLDLVQDALHYLIDELRDSDQVAIVAYQARARVLRPMTPVRSRAALHGAVDDLTAGGSTNLEAGLVTGYRVARDGLRRGATNRVILLSDGLANVGNTDPDPILHQIREEAAKQITLLGVGVGSEYGDQLMQRLADEGDGFVTYVSERGQARDIFVHRLPATLSVRALDAKVQVSFDPKTVVSYRLVGYDNRLVDPADFRNDRVDGGEVGPGHSVTALYLVRLRGGPDAPAGMMAQARVRWLDPIGREPQESAATVGVADLSADFFGASPRLWVGYAAAYFAEILRHSRFAAQVRPADLAAVADEAYLATEDPQVGELAELIRRFIG